MAKFPPPTPPHLDEKLPECSNVSICIKSQTYIVSLLSSVGLLTSRARSVRLHLGLFASVADKLNNDSEEVRY